MYINWDFSPANIAIAGSVFLQAQLYFHLQNSFQFFLPLGAPRDNEPEDRMTTKQKGLWDKWDPL
jgi:hypothetical protein